MNTSIEETPLNEKIVFTLAEICQLSNFIYGEAWIPIPEENILQLSPNYYIAPDTEKQNLEEFKNSKPDFFISIQQFWVCSQEFIISRGEGLPGRVWLSKKPEWILDVTAKSEGYFLRNQIAKAFGIKTGFAVPVIADNQVLMVLAFFALDIRPKDFELLKIAMKETEKLANRLSTIAATGRYNKNRISYDGRLAQG